MTFVLADEPFAGVINCGLSGTFALDFADGSTRTGAAGFSAGAATGCGVSVAVTTDASRSARCELTTAREAELNLRVPTVGLAKLGVTKVGLTTAGVATVGVGTVDVPTPGLLLSVTVGPAGSTLVCGAASASVIAA